MNGVTIDRRLRGIAAAAAGLLLLLVAALAIAGAWPFDGTGKAGTGHHEVWSGNVALLADGLYALDTLPVYDEGSCLHCLGVMVGPRGQLTLQAGNGILGWPSAGEPTYAQCVALRNKSTLDSVALGAPRTSLSAVSLHGFMCATGAGNDGLIRMQYNGRQGRRYRFAVVSWGRPLQG